MNAPTPLTSSPDEPNPGPMEYYPAPSSTFRLGRFLVFLRKYWWLPVLTLILALSGAITYVRWIPPSYVSIAQMWETGKLRIPEGSFFTEDLQTFLGTQIDLLRSPKLRRLALTRLKASNTNAVPLDKDGKEASVDISVTPGSKSSVFTIRASSQNAAYTEAYLNALMIEYLEYKRNQRKVTSGDTLASITEQVQRLERELKTMQTNYTAFQRTNNLAVLQEEGTIAGSYLARLKTQLSDFKLEGQLLEATALEQSRTPPGETNSLMDLIDPLRLTTSAPASSAPSEQQTAFTQLELLKIQRAKLSQDLRPAHPKMVKLDADIERANKLIEIFRRQSRDQNLAAQEALKMKMDSVLASIKEWEAKVIEANARIAEAEHFKLEVGRTQTLYDRLVNLLQNLDISRNIDQETLSILEPASPAVRSYQQNYRVLTLAIFGSLFISLGIILLVALVYDGFISLEELRGLFAEEIIGQVPELKDRKSKTPLPLVQLEDDRHTFTESYRNLRSSLLYLGNGTANSKALLVTSSVPSEGKSTVAINLARALAFGGANVLLVDGDLRRGNLHSLLGGPAEPGLSDLLIRLSAQAKSQRVLGTGNGIKGAEQGEESGKQSLEGEEQKSEIGGQGTDGGGQRTEDRGQGTEGRGQRAEDGGQRTEGSEQKAEDIVAGTPSSIVHRPSSIDAPLILDAESALAFDACIRSTDLPNLAFLPCGKLDRSPGELFLSRAFGPFLDRARCLFDYVIVDSIPVFAADDTTTLAPKMDGVLFVVRRRFSTVSVVREALDLLYQRQTKVLGLVFNRADSSSRSYHYYKNDDYHRPRKRT